MIGNEIQRARLDAGMTQEELASKAQIDRSYVSLLENDKKTPTLDMLFRICEALDVKASTLVARVERHRN